MYNIISSLCIPTLQAKYNIVKNVHEELRGLYQWLEVDFHPLKLAERVAAPLKYIASNNELNQYVPALQDITTTRVLKQVCITRCPIAFMSFGFAQPCGCCATHFSPGSVLTLAILQG